MYIFRKPHVLTCLNAAPSIRSYLNITLGSSYWISSTTQVASILHDVTRAINPVIAISSAMKEGMYMFAQDNLSPHVARKYTKQIKKVMLNSKRKLCMKKWKAKILNRYIYIIIKKKW